MGWSEQSFVIGCYSFIMSGRYPNIYYDKGKAIDANDLKWGYKGYNG